MATRAAGAVGTAGVAVLLLVSATMTPAGAAPVAQAVRTCPPITVTPDATWSTTQGIPPGVTGSRLAPAPTPDRAQTSLDMDGDGTADTTSGVGTGPLVVGRGDGNLTVTGLPETAIASSAVTGDDLDGDGRSELVISVAGGSSATGGDQVWIVPGTTPPGTVAVADVSAAFDGSVTGDVTGDGLDDLFVVTPFIKTVLPLGWASGAEVVAALPSDAPFAELDFVALRVDLDFDGTPDTVRRIAGGGTSIALSTGPTLALDPGSPLSVSAYRSGTRTILQTTALTTGVLVRGFEVRAACADAWMRAAVPHLMFRLPTAADYPTFGPTSEPTRAQRLERTQAMVRSQSTRLIQVDGWYDYYLGRDADPVGRAYWLKGLRNGTQTPDTMAATFLGSREFLQKRTAGDPESWVQAAFPLAMNRRPDPSGLAYWTQQASKLGAPRAAARLLASPEARRFKIKGNTNSIHALGGDPPPHVMTRSLADYAAGGYDNFVARLLASDEVYLRAQQQNRMKLG